MAPLTNPKPKISLPFTTKLQLSLLTFITDSLSRPDGTVNRRIMNFLDRPTPPNPTQLHGVTTHDITVNPTTNLWFRLFIPPSTSSSPAPIPVLVFFHGGGFVFLSAASQVYDAVCRRFAKTLNVVVCSVNYRLAPEHKFPSQYEDGSEVLQFLDKHRQEIPNWPENADVSRCFIAGDSAGGNISHHVAVRASEAPFENLRVIGLVNIQPFFGGKERLESEILLEGAPLVSTARTEFMWRALFPGGSDPDHWAANVCGPNGKDISGLDYPNTLVFVGGFDPLKDWQKRYCEWLRKSGQEVKLVEYPSAIHAFYIFPALPESNLLFHEVKEFIEKQCSKFSAQK